MVPFIITACEGTGDISVSTNFNIVHQSLWAAPISGNKHLQQGQKSERFQLFFSCRRCFIKNHAAVNSSLL